MTNFRDWPHIGNMTPDERLTAAAIIMRDAIEKHDAEAASPRESARSPQEPQSGPTRVNAGLRRNT